MKKKDIQHTCEWGTFKTKKGKPCKGCKIQKSTETK